MFKDGGPIPDGNGKVPIYWTALADFPDEPYLLYQKQNGVTTLGFFADNGKDYWFCPAER